MHAAAALALREGRDALAAGDEGRCAAALALLTGVLVQRADVLLRAGDAAAVQRLQAVLALVEHVAQTATPGSAAHRLAQTILGIVAG